MSQRGGKEERYVDTIIQEEFVDDAHGGKVKGTNDAVIVGTYNSNI